MDYSRLNSTNSDRMRFESAAASKNIPWMFENYLPSKVYLYHIPQFTRLGYLLADLKPQEKIKRYRSSGGVLKDGDTIEVFHNLKGESFAFRMTPSYTLKANLKDIKIGTVTYSSAAGGRENTTSFSDISGVMIHNNLMFPLNIYYQPRNQGEKPNMVAQVGAYDGMTYLGGGVSNVYFDNSREGLRIGDRLAFEYSIPEHTANKYSIESTTKMFTITLTDNHIYHINVGVVNAGHDTHTPDTYAHNIDKPVLTGYTFYDNTGAPSNPNAAF